MTQSIILLIVGILVVISPIIFGLVDSAIFYTNIVAGTIIILIALRKILDQKNKI